MRLTSETNETTGKWSKLLTTRPVIWAQNIKISIKSENE